MNKIQMLALQRVREVRDAVVEHDVKSGLVDLTELRQELGDAPGQLSAAELNEGAIMTQSPVQTLEVDGVVRTLRNRQIEAIVRTSRTMKLEINGGEMMFVLRRLGLNSERVVAACYVMARALGVLGLQLDALGIVSSFVEFLSNNSVSSYGAVCTGRCSALNSTRQVLPPSLRIFEQLHHTVVAHRRDGHARAREGAGFGFAQRNETNPWAAM